MGKIVIKNQNFDKTDNIDKNSFFLMKMHCIQYMNHDKHIEFFHTHKSLSKLKDDGQLGVW